MTRHVNFLGLGFRLKWRDTFVDICLRCACGGETLLSQSFSGSKLFDEHKECSELSKKESEKLGKDEFARISYISCDKSQQSVLT